MAYGFASVLLSQVINSTEAMKGYKTIISVFNLASLLYLSYWNSWCRNKIIGLVNGRKKRTEDH